MINFMLLYNDSLFYLDVIANHGLKKLIDLQYR